MTQERWDIRRQGRRWTREESRAAWSRPGKDRVRGWNFASELERRTVLGMLLENLGIDTAVDSAISPTGRRPSPIGNVKTLKSPPGGVAWAVKIRLCLMNRFGRVWPGPSFSEASAVPWNALPHSAG